MSNLPSGTVTFLFTDIEGSTQLWEQYPEKMKAALAQHDLILKHTIEANNGHIVKTTGDGVHAVFVTALDSINAATISQRNLQSLKYSLELKVRMGIHTGEAELRDGDYYGQALNRVARIMDVAYGGQILLSALTADLVRSQLGSDMDLLDLGEHRLKDLTRTVRILQLVAPGQEKDFPPLKSLNRYSNNLPIQITSFIGRERELKEAKEKLLPSPLWNRNEAHRQWVGGSAAQRDDGTRLLTLIGPGGTGKTRLSLQLGANVLQDFRDGVWLAELASLSDPSLVLQTIASALNIREQPGMPLKDLVLDYLREKQLLLILDNCEHLIETCAQVADELLRNAPDMKILASSREALGINGETVYRVPSLSSPEQYRATRETIRGYESVQLFVERATAANPKFQLTDENALAVAQICHRLDGIPLALELAASRVTVFSAEQIASRLDDRFKLLTGGSRTALPRQQTLRALIDWSYDILTHEEQALLRRLSIFAGGWTYEAGEAVCGDPNFLENLSQLVNKSLVVVDEGAEIRYRLLETIRQYARDKLLESGEGKEFRNQHLAYFLQLTESAEPYILGSDSMQWANKLRAEYDNIRAALSWAQTENLEAALRMMGVLPYFWITQGYTVEGRRWAMDLIDRAQSGPDKYEDMNVGQLTVRANALLALSILGTDHGDNETVRVTAAESVVLARKSGDQRILAFALAYLAAAILNIGDPDRAYALAQESLAVAPASGSEFALGFSLATMGEITAIAKQDYAGAMAYAEKSLALSKKGGFRWGHAMTVFGLGFMARSLGDYDQARARFKACLPAFLEIGDKHRINMIQSELGHIERELGQYQQAIPIYRETILEWQRLGHRAAIAHQLECFAYMAKTQGQTDRALRLLGAAEALRERIDIAMTPLERVEYDREVADLRRNMDQTEFTALWNEGRSTTMEQAIQLALG